VENVENPPAHRCRAKRRPPGSTCKPAPSRCLLMGAKCGCRRSNKSAPQASRRRSRAGGSRGVSRRRGLPQRLVPRHIVQAVAAAALRRVGAARRPLPPSPLLTSLSSCLLMPDAAADPSTSLRSFLAPLRCRAGSHAAAWVWRVAPLVRLRRLFLGVPHPRLRFSGSFGWLSKVRKLHPGSTLQTRSQPPQADQGSFGLRTAIIAWGQSF
jgi:hypothetical protein